MKEIEIEFKVLLTKEEHQDILKDIKFDNFVEQTNYYFETEDFILKQNKLSLRIRQICNRFYLMLKDGKNQEAIEVNVEISNDEFDEMMTSYKINNYEINGYLKDYQLENLILDNNAKLKTFRYYTPYRDCILFLDESHYYGVIDYELELEAKSVGYGQKIINEISSKYNLTTTGVSGKKTRAYANKK